MAEAGAGWLSRLGPLLWAAAVAAGSVWCWPPVRGALSLADLPTSPAARPDGSLAAAVGPAAIWTEAAWDGRWHSPSRWAPAPAMRVPACSPPLMVGRGFQAEALCRGPFRPLGREGRLPRPTAVSSLPSPGARTNAAASLLYDGGGHKLLLGASSSLTAAPWTTPGVKTGNLAPC